MDPLLGPGILDSAKFYETKTRWHITLFLLMPDHLHAILSFARDQSMSDVIRDWKRFHARTNRVLWQEGYFDHRLRADERGGQLSAKMNYIRQNPVAVAVGVGLGVGVGVGVGVTPPWPGAWISTVIGEPVLKKPTVALAVCGGWSASKRKLYSVPKRIAFAFWFVAKVSVLQVIEPL